MFNVFWGNYRYFLPIFRKAPECLDVRGRAVALVRSLVVEILNSDHLRHKAMATFVLWGNEHPSLIFYILSAAVRMRFDTSHNAPRSITFSSSVKPPVPPFPSMPSSLW